jgi:hypothetical protein
MGGQQLRRFAALFVAAPASAAATFIELRASGHPLHVETESLAARLLHRRSRAA